MVARDLASAEGTRCEWELHIGILQCLEATEMKIGGVVCCLLCHVYIQMYG